MRTQSGSREGGGVMSGISKARALAAKPSSYAGMILLVIACTLAFVPEIPPALKDLLMVTFACVALLPGQHDAVGR